MRLFNIPTSLSILEQTKPPKLAIPKELKEFLSVLNILNVKDIVLFLQIIKLKKVKAGDILVHTGSQNECFFVVLNGLLRNYVVMTSGDERTLRFTDEGRVSGTPNTLQDGRPANESIVALENSLIAQISRKEVEILSNERPNVRKFYLEHMKLGMLEMHEHISFHILLTPEERYQFLIENHPKLLQRAQVKHIASYIGVTPVSLSRIRARSTKGSK